MMSSLEKIANFSFTANHLLNFQLMRDLEKTQTNRPEYFFFVSFIPGIQGVDGNRTYDFPNNISIKYIVYEIAALSFALKQYAQGNGKHINYIKFSKSETGQKSVILEEITKSTTGKNGEQYMQRQILFKVTVNGNTKAITLSIEQAYAIGETLDILFKKAANLEFNRTIHNVSFASNKVITKPTNQFNSTQPPIIQPPVIEPEPTFKFNIGTDDNTNFLNNGFNNTFDDDIPF